MWCDGCLKVVLYLGVMQLVVETLDQIIQLLIQLRCDAQA